MKKLVVLLSVLLVLSAVTNIFLIFSLQYQIKEANKKIESVSKDVNYISSPRRDGDSFDTFEVPEDRSIQDVLDRIDGLERRIDDIY